MGWTIYNSQGEPLVTQEQHDHTSADASGPMTDDEHDGFSEYDEIAAPGAGAANKGRLYSVDRAGYTTLEWVDSGGVLAPVSHPPAVRVRNTSTQNCPDGASTAITFNTERFDTDGMHSTSSNTSRLTATTAGIYLITAHVRTPGAGRRFFSIRKDGGNSIAVVEWKEGVVTTASLTTIYALAATEYVELIVSNFSGSDFSTNVTSDYTPEFAMVWMAPLP